MKNILAIYSSLNGEQGRSTQLANTYLQTLTAGGDYNVVKRDLAAQPLPHLTQEEMQSWSQEQPSSLAKHSDDLIAEVKQADMIIVAMPMYNFGVPSTFKAWIDRVARAGKTFQYTETGPVGLIEGKKILVTAARGGQYVGTAMDTQTKYLKDVFGFMGMTDIDFIYAEGLNMGLADTAIAKAHEQIKAHIAAL